MAPVTPVMLSPYRKYVCWHGMKRKEAHGPERFCGEFGERCIVSRPTEMIDRLLGRLFHEPFKWTRPSSNSITVYLCRKHREKMQEKGYIVTKVTKVTLPVEMGVSNVESS